VSCEANGLAAHLKKKTGFFRQWPVWIDRRPQRESIRGVPSVFCRVAGRRAADAGGIGLGRLPARAVTAPVAAPCMAKGRGIGPNCAGAQFGCWNIANKDMLLAFPKG